MKQKVIPYFAGTGTSLNISSPILYFGQVMLKYAFTSAALYFSLCRISSKYNIASMCLGKITTIY